LTIFEYLSVAASIVLALGLSTLITSIPYVFDAKKRDWLHSLAFFLLAMSHLLVWWRIWPLNSVADWNILGFAILMGSPLSLYLAATALVSNNPDQVESWKEQFAQRSQWFFSAMASVVCMGIIRGLLFLDRVPSWWSIVMLGALVFAAYSRRRSIHITVLSLWTYSFAALVYLGFNASQL
jgi:hypothetical protein